MVFRTMPTPNVSLVDVTFEVEKDTTTEEVNKKLREAANGPLKHVLGYTDEEPGSLDYNGCAKSSLSM